MAYSELIKNFEKIRSYMRDFYIYGFRTRTEFVRKSARSYDNERRRVESWLKGAVSFRQDAPKRERWEWVSFFLVLCHIIRTDIHDASFGLTEFDRFGFFLRSPCGINRSFCELRNNIVHRTMCASVWNHTYIVSPLLYTKNSRIFVGG